MWAYYLFCNLDQSQSKVARHEALSESIQERILDLEAASHIANFDENGFKVGMRFDSFHHQAKYQISDGGLLSSFLML